MEINGLTVIEVPGDGDCLFHSFSVQLFFNNIFYDTYKLREILSEKCICLYQSQERWFNILCEKTIEARYSHDLESYFENIKSPRIQWGGEFELMMLCFIFNCDINLHIPSIRLEYSIADLFSQKGGPVIPYTFKSHLALVNCGDYSILNVNHYVVLKLREDLICKTIKFDNHSKKIIDFFINFKIDNIFYNHIKVNNIQSNNKRKNTNEISQDSILEHQLQSDIENSQYSITQEISSNYLSDINTRRTKKLKNLSFDKEYIKNLSGKLHENVFVKEELQNFKKKMKKWKYQYCKICHEYWFSRKKYVEKTCFRCKSEKQTHRFSKINNMIPSCVPPELECLSQLEELLIARASIYAHVFSKPGGQLAFKSHCIHFLQDVNSFSSSLPRALHEIPFLFVRKEVNDKKTIHRVSRKKVYNALIWLKSNRECISSENIFSSLVSCQNSKTLLD